MIISKTPLRISFVGGGTDIASYYSLNNHGCVISTAIASYIYVIVKKQSEIFDEKFRLNYSETELIYDIEKIKNPIIRECLKYLKIDEKIYIATIADVPSSTGLGSSSSFCVGLLNALYKYKKEKVSQERLAEEACNIEINVLKKPIGKQDQYASALGNINLIKFNDDHSVKFKSIDMEYENKKKLFDSILIFWSGIQRSADTILLDQKKNHNVNIDLLNNLKECSYHLYNELIKDDISLKEVGKIIQNGWKNKKLLSNLISSNFIDEAFNIGMKSGAYGGKILGAGGGGFILLIADEKDHENIENNLKKINFYKYKFGYAKEGTMVTNFD